MALSTCACVAPGESVSSERACGMVQNKSNEKNRFTRFRIFRSLTAGSAMLRRTRHKRKMRAVLKFYWGLAIVDDGPSGDFKPMQIPIVDH